MKRLFLCLLVLSLSTSAYSQDEGNSVGIQVVTYADGVLLEAENNSIDIQLTVVGPNNSVISQKYSGGETVFLDINAANGGQLPDGLYKYEAWPVPAVTISREESSKMPNRNDISLKAGPAVSPVSGSFRIVNGAMADPDLVEFSAANLGGASE
jgi:hypothetical protein